uniref:Cysteine desulfurase n=1 Tax=uncultured bacterium A1Q1_fos_568 TaxID=1256586 RepID=L7VQI7_9BACT|nr:cysteine desulfurase [uncultured bacterium A1Q1_fos_568]
MRPVVREAMAPFLGDRYGNPSGSHRLARDAVRAVDEARERVAAVLGCLPGEVVFTSGGTESDNHAVTGGMPPRDGVPVCSAVEHHAVLDPVLALGGRTVGVDRWGRIDPVGLAAVLDELGPDVSVVSVMLANNETGVLNDLDAVAAILRAHGPEVPRTPLHTDAVQAAAWLDLSVAAAAADLVSVSGHKLGGPKGVGALVVRQHTQIRPLLLGGGQERGRRSGTSNVAGIVGLAAALDATAAERAATNSRVAALADRLRDGLAARVPGLVVTVPGDSGVATLPGICHVCLVGVDAETLLFLMESDGVVASAASSCSSGAQRNSHVLAAMGVPDDLAKGSLRLSLGWDSTDADVDLALEVVPAAVRRVLEFA